MGMSQGDEHGTMSEINVTPFVDVMLVLLIIFMVTAPMMNQGIEIELPESDAPPLTTDEENPIKLKIDANGKYYIGTQEFDLEKMKTQLALLAKDNNKRVVKIEADGRVPYEKVMKIFSACTLAGLTNFELPTQPETPK